MCAADVAVSVPAGDQRSSSVLEAALAGCRLLLSDIAPYREMVRDGLTADLLAEPVSHSLADALRQVRPDKAGQLANAEFIRVHEHGADKAAALAQIYRELRA
jgi:glycosyltransferase involved in cell wall biosynthesis